MAKQPDPALDGFRLLPNGDFALDARLALVEHANSTLDVQYYHIEADATGLRFLDALRTAAQRGVRVRLLVDDLYASALDPMLLALAAAPNFEVRLYNPLPSRSTSLATRFSVSLLYFDRLQRRMHNKMLLADGALAVVGGRNIGDRYFSRAFNENFLDMDVLAAGPIVSRLGSLFDSYWNDVSVMPIEQVSPSPNQDEDRATTIEFPEAKSYGRTVPTANHDMLGNAPVSQEIKFGALSLTWARSEAYADSPRRALGDARAAATPATPSVRMILAERFGSAQRSILLCSPYLVPGERGMEVLRNARAREVSVRLITNSLSASDEPFVHTAYRRYRRELLQNGVQIEEVSGSNIGRSSILPIYGSVLGRLHTKTAIIDDEVLYVGSLNFDPRSEAYNTEFGLFIKSAELARQMLWLADVLRDQGVWQVRLNSSRMLVWRGDVEGLPRTLSEEPDSTVWDRVFLDLVAPFTPEYLL